MHYRLLHRSVFVSACAAFLNFGQADVVRQPLQTGVIFDMGQIVHSNYPEVHDGQMLQSTSLLISQSVDVNERLNITIGVGGLFFYSIPNVIGLSYQRSIKYGTIVDEAMGSVKLGAVDHPMGHLQFGIIPFKYNRDAKNLGEFLLRDNAYPTTMVSGGVSIINSAGFHTEGAGFQAEGVNLEMQTGPITHDLLVYTERGIEPNGDITPAYVFSYKPHPAIELGGGVAFAHLISLKPSRTTPNGPGPGISDASAPSLPLNRYKNDTLVTDIKDSGYSNYTYQSIKVMARVAVNFQSILHSELLGPEDLKLYSEVAILGVQNYPFYYSDIWNRIPVMGGVNLPTFRLLDRLSFEMEYLKTAFPNNIYFSYWKNSLPVPGIVTTGQTYHELVASWDKNSLSSRDIKWSLYLKRKVIPGLTLYAQVASDHMRGYDANVGPNVLVPLPEPIIRTPSDWYYLVRLDLGI